MDVLCCSSDMPKKPSISFSDEEFASLCKALGHPARVRLLRLLRSKGECITGDLADELPLAASTVSEHLRILKEAGLIQGAIDGPRRSYCVHAANLKLLRSMMTELAGEGI